MEVLKQAMEDGENVMISDFGKFKVADKAERKGRNPATGEDMMIPAWQLLGDKSIIKDLRVGSPNSLSPRKMKAATKNSMEWL